MEPAISAVPVPVIRAAVEADLPTLVHFGRQFAEQAKLFDRNGERVPYSPAGAEAQFRSMMGHGLLFVADADGGVVGTIGVVIGPYLINPDFGMASELFWWVEPAYRRTGAGDSLMDAAEDAARSAGATFFTMVALEGGTVDVARKIYGRRGYRPAEYTFTKAL